MASLSVVSLSAIFLLIPWTNGQELLIPRSSSGDSIEDHSLLQRQPSSDVSDAPNVKQSSCNPGRVEQQNSCDEQYSDEYKTVVCIDGKYSLTPCNCLSNESGPLFGYCQYTCFRNSFLTAPNITSLLHNECSPFHRTGNFCEKCTENTSYPAYSFTLMCVKCQWRWMNLVIYIALAYGPLTVFLLLIMIFRVSVNSAPLLGFIFVSQISTMPFQMRLGQGLIEANNTILHPYQVIGLKILSTVYGIWNLDFFRSIIPPFCIHPNWKTINVMCLDYIISSFPCVVIIITYTIVVFYSRGYKIFFWWKPFHWCFSRLRNEMNIKTSLVDAFGTFFSLSYAKTLNTTFDILAFTTTWDSEGNSKGNYFYYDTKRFDFNSYRVLLGLFFFSVFNILPIVILFIHSLRKPQHQALGHIENERRFFQPLLNTLVASYRDGSDGGCNCRFFSVVYLVARIAICVTLMLTPNIFFQFVAAIILLATGMLVAVIRPYKSNVYNTVDIILMLSLALSYTSIAAYYFASFISPTKTRIIQFFCEVVCNVPLAYMTGLVLYHTVMVCRLPQRGIKKTSKYFRSLKNLLARVAKRFHMSPLHELPTNIRGTRTTYIAIESDTLRVSNVDLCQ